MKVLVTGANGFLGSWLVRKLCKMQLEVRILVRESSDLSELNGCEFEKLFGDITDLAAVKQACRGVEAVFHLAGLVAYTRKDRSLMQSVNVQGTKNIIAACADADVSRLVHVSSVTAVGASFDKTAMNEESAYNIKHLDLGYFETKREAEEAVIAATRTGKIDAVMVNPSTIYGPGDAKKGSRSAQLKVAKGAMPFFTRGGVNVVDVENVVDGIISAWRNGITGERYILCGENITIEQLFNLIAEKAGVPPPKICMPNFALHLIGKFGDLLERFGSKGPLNSENAWTATLYHWFDSSKAERDLGFKPSSAATAISRSVNWSKENGLI